jgi:protein KTI12
MRQRYWYVAGRLEPARLEADDPSQKPATQQDYLYELDKNTSDIVSQILQWQKDHEGEGGGTVRVPELDVDIHLPMNKLSLPQLQRIRRQFITLNRQHGLEKSRIRVLFVDYLNDSFRN